MGRAMVVDDSAFMRASLRKLLAEAGHEVVMEAEDGEDALKKWRAFERKPDFITMDITMPVMDGITCLKQLKAEDPSVCVIMVSAMGQQAMVVDSITSGAKNFIVKPFKDESKIIAMFRDLC